MYLSMEMWNISALNLQRVQKKKRRHEEDDETLPHVRMPGSRKITNNVEFLSEPKLSFSMELCTPSGVVRNSK